jgi:hypothetical protein
MFNPALDIAFSLPLAGRIRRTERSVHYFVTLAVKRECGDNLVVDAGHPADSASKGQNRVFAATTGRSR